MNIRFRYFMRGSVVFFGRYLGTSVTEKKTPRSVTENLKYDYIKKTLFDSIGRITMCLDQIWIC